MANDRWILYGATGFTGELIAEAAARRGLRPVLAGRSPEKVARLAERYGFEHAAASLDDAASLRKLVDGAAAVLHCAGPFVDTSLPMLRACLDAKASYLDITGELPVFEQSFAHDAQAKERGVAVISGVGFDVVPTDCVARYVAEKVPGARSLEIAIMGLASTSAGTKKSAIGIMNQGGVARRGGKLAGVPFGRGAKRVKFPPRERWVVPAPLADLSTAWHSTGIPDITTYMAVSTKTAKTLGRVWPLLAVVTPVVRRVVALKPVEERLRKSIEGGSRGPDATARANSKAYAWARASSGAHSVEATIELNDPYDYTAEISLSAVEQVLGRQGPLIGALPPAVAFGTEFALRVGGAKLHA